MPLGCGISVTSTVPLDAIWLKPLRESGFFKRPPEIVLNDKDGSIYSYAWPESNYLARMAKLDPDEVLDIIVNDVPYVENTWVLGDLVDVALNMNSASVGKLVDKINLWIQAMCPIWTPDKLGELIIHLASRGEFDSALSLARVVFEIIPDPRTAIWPGTKNYHMFMPDLKAHVEPYDYDRLLRTVFPKLIESIGLPAFELQCDLLDLAVSAYKKYPGEDDDLAYSTIWLPSIEVDWSYNDNLKDSLIFVLRDSAERIAKSNGELIHYLIKALETRHSKIFHRIALYVVRKYPQHAVHIISSFLTDNTLFNDLQIIREYRVLFKTYFKILSVDQQKIFFSWIEAGPDVNRLRSSREKTSGKEIRDEELVTYRKAWQGDRLALIKEYLPSDWKGFYDGLVMDMGEPNSLECPAFQVSSRDDPTSQKSFEELKNLPIKEIIEFLKNFKSDDEFYGPSKYDLQASLCDVIAGDPNKFDINAMMFGELDFVYIKALFQGLKKSIEKGHHLQWHTIFGLCNFILERSIKDNENNYDIDNLCYREIIELLESGFDIENEIIPFNLRIEVWPILCMLSSDRDPTPERESKQTEEDSGLAFLALSTIRGQALIAVIRYALWVNQHTGKLQETLGRGFDQMPEVRTILEMHLDPDVDPSLAVRAIYGMEFPRIVFLDSSWALSQVNTIFPIEESKLRLWDAAWKSYLLFNRAYDNIVGILNKQYSTAIERLVNLKDGLEQRTNLDGHSEGKLTEHIIYLYWRGIIDPQDVSGIFLKFWNYAPESIRGHALHIIGFVLYHNDDPISPEIMERLKFLLDYRITTIKTSNANPSELREYGWWFSSGKFDEIWSINKLIDVLSIVNEIKLDFRVIERLNSLASDNPRDTLRCLELIIKGKQNKWQIHGWEDDIRSIIGSVLNFDDIPAAKSATDLINYLGSLGYLEYRDLLK